jgi:C4-dicarboxylate-specific signal transduction histidine kinase
LAKGNTGNGAGRRQRGHRGRYRTGGTKRSAIEPIIRLDLANGLPEVLGDHVQLQQVIINLVMNGVEAMTAGQRPPERW